MTTTNLDITGKVCPYCLLEVQKAASRMKYSDSLVIRCDHPPAATATIPQFATENGLDIISRKIGPGLWEITLTKH